MILRLKQRLRLIVSHGAELNRRVEVEATLLKMYNGSVPLPDKEKCRELAIKLGTPKKYWSKKL